jgi:hypothetical protein
MLSPSQFGCLGLGVAIENDPDLTEALHAYAAAHDAAAAIRPREVAIAARIFVEKLLAVLGHQDRLTKGADETNSAFARRLAELGSLPPASFSAIERIIRAGNRAAHEAIEPSMAIIAELLASVDLLKAHLPVPVESVAADQDDLTLEDEQNGMSNILKSALLLGAGYLAGKARAKGSLETILADDIDTAKRGLSQLGNAVDKHLDRRRERHEEMLRSMNPIRRFFYKML